MKLDSRMPEGEKIKGVPLEKDGQNTSPWSLLLHFFHYEEHFMNKIPLWSLCVLCSASKPALGKEAKGSTELQLDSESETPRRAREETFTIHRTIKKLFICNFERIIFSHLHIFLSGICMPIFNCIYRESSISTDL